MMLYTNRFLLAFKRSRVLENDPFFQTHRELVNLIHRLTYGKNPLTLVESLVTHFIFHFIEEDQLMRVIGYPQRSQHSKEHDSIKEQIVIMAPRLLSGNILEEEIDLFKDRVIHHIQTHDQHFIRYLDNYHKPLLDNLLNEHHSTD